MRQHPDANSVLSALWPDARPAGSTSPPDPARVRRLAQALGEQAMRCVAGTLGGRRAEVVQGSADLLETMVSLWAACGLSPDEIWIELHKREQLGSLLMQLNQAQSQVPRRVLKPWRVDSTKLP